MIQTNLKPCPLCKTKPYTKIEPKNSHEIHIKIICNNPECGISMKRIVKSDFWINSDQITNEIDEMIWKWNGRAKVD